METELSRMNILRLSNEESNRVTREALQTAMFRLMGENAFEKITVSEITKRAGVSRAAFYRNYESKEALVEALCESILDGITQSINGDLFRNDRKAWYLSVFKTIQKNCKYFQIYLDAHLSLSDQFILETALPSSTLEEHYCNAAREGAFLSILTGWFRAGMHETPEEMARLSWDILGHLN